MVASSCLFISKELTDLENRLALFVCHLQLFLVKHFYDEFLLGGDFHFFVDVCHMFVSCIS